MNTTKSIIIAIVALTSGTIFAQTKIKDNSAGGSVLPNTNAILELESNNKGLLLPRIALVSLSSASPLANHIAGMLVYNTTLDSVNNLYPGIYVNNGTGWIKENTTTAGLWYNQQNNTVATNVTDSIYQIGNVAIGKDSAFIKNVALDVNGAVRFGAPSDFELQNPDSIGVNSFSTGTNNIGKGANSTNLGDNNNQDLNAISSLNIGQFNYNNGTGNILIGKSNFGDTTSKYSLALGQSNQVSGTANVAFGQNNNVNTDYFGAAFGILNNVNAPGVAIGGANEINAYFALGIGLENVIYSNGELAAALGQGHKVSGIAALAVGRYDSVSGNMALAIGRKNISSGEYALSLGEEDTASGVLALAIGSENKASGNLALAIGTENTATGDLALAIGDRNDNPGYLALSIGTQNIASGNYAVGIGEQNLSSGQYGVAIGVGNNPSGNYTMNVGVNDSSSGKYNYLIGYGLKANNSYRFAMGRFNRNVTLTPDTSNEWSQTDPLFELGNGTSDQNRSNALTILKNGSLGIGNILPSQAIDIETGTIRLRTINDSVGQSSDKIVVADANGVLKTISPTNSIISRNANYTLSSNDNSVVYNVNGLTFTLPSPSENFGKKYTIISKVEAGSITLSATSGSIYKDGVITASLSGSFVLQSDGTDWLIIK